MLEDTILLNYKSKKTYFFTNIFISLHDVTTSIVFDKFSEVLLNFSKNVINTFKWSDFFII